MKGNSGRKLRQFVPTFKYKCAPASNSDTKGWMNEGEGQEMTDNDMVDLASHSGDNHSENTEERNRET
jgi:hypothetical protein